ncbi:MAG: 30S ribosome-binding factor RbfA [Gemmatimonadota bacterium]
MSKRRLARLNEQLKRELAMLIRTDVRDPRVGVVTVTAVDVTNDLSMARVFVRAMGSESEIVEALEGLNAAAPFLRAALGKELTIRRIPELRFQRDKSLEHAMRIEEILSDVLPEDEPEGATESDAGEPDAGESDAGVPEPGADDAPRPGDRTGDDG